MLAMSRLLIDEQSKMMARKTGKSAVLGSAGDGGGSDQRRSYSRYE